MSHTPYVGYAQTLIWSHCVLCSGRVVIVDLNEDAGKAYAEELNKKAGSAVAISAKADTTKFEEQLAAYELAKEKFGRIDYGTPFKLPTHPCPSTSTH